MDRTIDLYQFVNELALDGVVQPNRGDLAAPDSLDDETIREENAREFYRFESALPVVSGTHDQVRLYATAQEHSGKASLGEKQDERARNLSKIESGMKDELARSASKVRF
jgi:hypothetical protein